MNPFDLFIIHVAADAHVALELALHFERLGYRAWCYELDSLPGSSYIENIRRGIDAASVLLVLVSHRSLERGDEVTREIHFGQAGDKPFIPVVLDLSDAEFERTVPLTWRQAFGEAVRVQVESGRAEEATRRIAAGLTARGAKAREVDGADPRIRTIVQMLERFGKLDSTDPGKKGGWLRQRGQHVLRRSALVAAIAVVAALAVWQLPAVRRLLVPTQEQPSSTMTIWIVDPTLQGFGDREVAARTDYGILRRTMEEDLLKIANASNTVMQILNDHEIDMALVNAGCPDISKKFQIPDCAEKKAFDLLQIRAKIDPTFQGSPDGKRDLTLRIGRGSGVMMLPHSESLADANLTTLADWSAEQIAGFLSVSQEHIEKALAQQREKNRLLEDSLGSVSPPARDGKTGWLPSLVVSALAEQPPGAAEADIRRVLDQLRAALETENTDQVAAVFSSMAPDQQAAIRRYFDNIAELKVAFGPPEITVQGDSARAAFLRQDQFRDRRSGERTSLAVRLVAVLVRENGTWKVQSLQKPT